MNRRIHFGSALGTSIFLRLIVIGFPPTPLAAGTTNVQLSRSVGQL
jgi:hypothetical protein